MKRSTMRVVRALASFLVGFFLVTGWLFTPLGVLVVLAHLIPLKLFGAALMLGGIMILIDKFRMHGNFFLGVLWASTVFASLVQWHSESTHSITIFLYALTSAVYFEGFADTVNHKYG